MTLNEKNISIKSVDKGSVVVVCDREENHIKEIENQLGDAKMYETFSKDAVSFLETINAVKAKRSKQGHLRRKT